MMDVFSETKRSEVMSKIRGKGNKDTEIALISILRKYRITGWRRNQKIYGKPDFVFWKQRIAIFVDGCFWHQCPLHATSPKQNHEFWTKKLLSNVERDQMVNAYLEKTGWKVLRIWEHDLRDENKVVEIIRSTLQIDDQ